MIFTRLFTFICYGSLKMMLAPFLPPFILCEWQDVVISLNI
nr:MAG TPA: hypothetical protein [Caudoviricetes sp.]